MPHGKEDVQYNVPPIYKLYSITNIVRLSCLKVVKVNMRKSSCKKYMGVTGVNGRIT
jgi:hypothetical protein